MDWIQGFDVAVTVCDNDGNIIFMNNKAQKTFAKWGDNLVGYNLKNCHKPSSWETIQKLINHDEKNIYTIEKNGIKKLIYQAPWYDKGRVGGLVELSLEIPFEMPHFKRG